MTARKWIIIAILCVVLTACNQTQGVTDLCIDCAEQNQTWIMDPLPFSTIPMAPYNILFHSASSVVIDGFDVQINGVLIATVLPDPSTGVGANEQPLYFGETLWTPPAPGTYLIEVIAIENGQASSSAYVQITVIDDEDELATPSSTFSIEEIERCTYTALVNLNCRLGPGPNFVPIGFFLSGQSAPVVGNSADGYYWYVIAPDTGNACTVPNNIDFGTVGEDCIMPPIFTPMPTWTVTPAPAPTSAPIVPIPAPEGCTVEQDSGGVLCVAPCPAGANPGVICIP